eukprot:TRINITY_DN46349_c0_g1_i1.p1 TRINITY_DN46349_c0_g1~~TRINITY_DN46349_c0_g1_i1.p1  ORF type:complete len:388 (+),score=20.98 TRINITY_DN46349_c0_g1_i1:37-1200(+)
MSRRISLPPDRSLLSTILRFAVALSSAGVCRPYRNFVDRDDSPLWASGPSVAECPAELVEQPPCLAVDDSALTTVWSGWFQLCSSLGITFGCEEPRYERKYKRTREIVAPARELGWFLQEHFTIYAGRDVKNKSSYGHTELVYKRAYELSEHPKQQNESGVIFPVYHATSPEAVIGIECYGFRPSSDGMLGEGLYLAPSIEKSDHYATPCQEHGRSVYHAFVGSIKMDPASICYAIAFYTKARDTKARDCDFWIVYWQREEQRYKFLYGGEPLDPSIPLPHQTFQKPRLLKGRAALRKFANARNVVGILSHREHEDAYEFVAAEVKVMCGYQEALKAALELDRDVCYCLMHRRITSCGVSMFDEYVVGEKAMDKVSMHYELVYERSR